MDQKLWPFPYKPEAQWSAYDRDLVELMQTAYAEGFEPRLAEIESCIELGRYPDGRSVSLVFRGTRNGWEPFLGECGCGIRLGPFCSPELNDNACVCVRPPYRNAAWLALEWMRGRSLTTIFANFEFVAGMPAGLVRRPTEDPESAR